ncbi:MAG: hypothetical protein ABEN55_08310 [Bradymonadaceae bacterium]
MKKTLTMLSGVILGAGLMGVWFFMGTPGVGSMGDWLGIGSANSEQTGPPASERVRINGRVIQTGGQNDQAEEPEPERVEINGRVIRTRAAPNEQPPARQGGLPRNDLRGDRGGSRDREFEQLLRQYEERHEAYRDSLPVDPDVAERFLKTLPDGRAFPSNR